MIRRERRVTGPRFRYIVAGERGAVEYVTLAGFPLAISYHSPQPLDWVRPVPCDVLEGSCYGDGTVLGAVTPPGRAYPRRPARSAAA